jgi:hypothetical protein
MKVDATTSAIASGEAIVNDAVSIVVFESVLSLFYTHSNSHIVDFGSVPAQFVVVFFGSIVIGVAGGLVSALITKHLPLNTYFLPSESAGSGFRNAPADIDDDGPSSAQSSPSSYEADQESGHDNRIYLEVLPRAWRRAFGVACSTVSWFILCDMMHPPCPIRTQPCSHSTVFTLCRFVQVK